MSEQKTKELPKELLVKRSKLNLLTLPLCHKVAAQFFPGVNRITDPEVIQYLHDKKYNHGWLAQLESGALEILSGPAEKEPEVKTFVFTAMNASQAIEVVRGTFSIAALEKMSIDEQSSKDRKTVQDAIKDQIKTVETEGQGDD